MSATHVHLMLNHVPVLGAWFGLLLLVAGVGRNNEDFKRAGCVMFIASALLALPTYLTGEPSVSQVQGLPGFSGNSVGQHEAVAQLALSVLLVLAGLGGAALWFFGRKTIPRWFTLVLVLGAVLSGSLMIWTANLGGQIRHTEIRSLSAP